MTLFVALDLPGAARAALPGAPAPWRPVHRDDLHVTLAFLGSVPDADAVMAALPGAPPAAGELRVAGARLLPPRRPRVLAVELSDPTGACAALQAAVSWALASEGLYRPERRPWLPHVTLGRSSAPVGRDAPVPEVQPLAFDPEAVTLYRSRPGSLPAGERRYEALASWPVAQD